MAKPCHQNQPTPAVAPLSTAAPRVLPRTALPQVAQRDAAGSGINPEQLFADCWSAGYLSAIGLIAHVMKMLPRDVTIDTEVDLGPAGHDSHSFGAMVSAA